MPTVALRPRSGLELFDASFQFLRDNFALLFSTVVVIFIPLAVLNLLAAMQPTNILLGFARTVGDWIFNSAAQAATVVIVAKRYLGEDVTPADAIRVVGRRFGTVLAVTLVYGLAVGIGTIFFVVPGIWLAVTYFASMAVAMVEGSNRSVSFDRSAALTQGSKWRIVGVFLVAYLVYFVLTAVIGGGATVLSGPLLGTLLTVLVMACTYPFIATLTTLLYFDLRIRREGFDLDMMMETPAMGTAPVAG